jgi:hypothetical protein
MRSSTSPASTTASGAGSRSASRNEALRHAYPGSRFAGALDVEALVGPTQSFWLRRFDRSLYLRLVRGRGIDETVPFAARIESTLRESSGRWRATPLGESMTLGWPGLSARPGRGPRAA